MNIEIIDNAYDNFTLAQKFKKIVKEKAKFQKVMILFDISSQNELVNTIFNEIKEWSIANYAVGIKTIDNKKINIGYIKNSEEFKNQLEAVLPGKGTNKPQMWLWFAIFFGILFAQYFMYYFGKIPAPQSKNAGGTYMKKIESKIKTNWHPPAFNRSYKVVLFFRVEADGRVKDIQVKQSSGNEEQDNIAIQALTKSSPLPELPEELSQRGFVDVQFNFDYNLHEKTK